MRKLLTINAIGVFRVTETITLILLKRLIYNYLQVVLHRPSIEGSNRATRLPREDLPPWSCFFIGTLSQPLTLRAFLFNPPDPFPRGRSGPAGFPSPQGLPCPPTPARHLVMPW